VDGVKRSLFQLRSGSAHLVTTRASYHGAPVMFKSRITGEAAS
jgi:hypothetical protein